MKIMSFAWTTPQLLSGDKTVTRRNWKKQWVKNGDMVRAFNKNPRFGGKEIGKIQIENVSQVQLDSIDADELKKEGLSNMTPPEFVDWWIKSYPGSIANSKIWRIEFKLMN